MICLGQVPVVCLMVYGASVADLRIPRSLSPFLNAALHQARDWQEI